MGIICSSYVIMRYKYTFFPQPFSLFHLGPRALLYVSPAHGDGCKGLRALKLNKTSSKLYQKPTKLVVFVLKAVCSQPMPSPRLGLLSLDPKSTRCSSPEPLKLIARDAVSFFTAVSPRCVHNTHIMPHFSERSRFCAHFQVIFGRE